MTTHLSQPQRPGLADQDAEDAATMRQVPDLRAGLLVDARGHELGQVLAPVVEDAERGVPSAGDLARDLDDPRQQHVEVELRQERATDGEQFGLAVGVHAGVTWRVSSQANERETQWANGRNSVSGGAPRNPGYFRAMAD